MQLWATIAMLAACSAATAAPNHSARPESRPGAALVQVATVVNSPRPEMRPKTLEKKGNVNIFGPKDASFQDWIVRFKSNAEAKGFSRQMLSRAFEGVRYDADVVRRDRNQSEFTKTIWDYLDSAASDTRIRNGKAALKKHGVTLEKIETRFGVDKEVVLAIWGLESAYGTFRGSNDVIRSMATLAFDGRRAAFFEEQLIAALRILQNGDTDPRNMTGSWAGAMGHTQFMPTSYQSYAVDFTQDGKRDIWSDDPTDALASTAAYLKHFGWTYGQPWGVEVRLPKGFNYLLANRKTKKLPSEWAALGITGLSGTVPDHGVASILLPAGSAGAAFMIFDNFAVIERYNTADAYVIGVGYLSDRIKGGPAIQTPWPRQDRALTFDERVEMQKQLTSQGFDTQGVDGKIGPLTIAAVRAFQSSQGMVPDGYASLRLLKALR